MTELHITQISPKTASRIAAAQMIGDTYHMTIHRAARYLVAKGLGAFEYYTQWGTGTTLWKGPDGKSEMITVQVLESCGY